MENTEKKKEHTFPPLKKHEILPCLRQLGIDFNAEDFSNPSGSMEKYVRMLEILTEICTGISREEMIQPAFSGLKVLSFPEMHDDSIPFLNIFRACTKMMEISGIQDFSLKDFMVPCPKRLQRQLAAIINFLRYKEEKEIIVQELMVAGQQLSEKLAKWKDKHDSAAYRLSLLKEQTLEERKFISRLENECKQIESSISGLNTQQADIREEISELKSRNAHLKEAIEEKVALHDECVGTKKKLSAQIVSSPERFRKQILDVAQALQTEQKDSKLAEKRIRELGNWIGNVEESQSEADVALDHIQELRSEVTKQKGVLADLELCKQEILSKRQSLQDLDQTIVQVSRQASRAEDKLLQMRHHGSSRNIKNNDVIQQLHQRLLEAESVRAKTTARLEKIETDFVRMEREVNYEAEMQEKEENEVIRSYQRLEGIVTQHLDSFNSVLV